MSSTPAAGTYVIDASHSEVGFSVRHAGIARVRGQFTEFEGTFTVAEDFADSAANVTIKSASIDTRDENRDNHLRSPEFWDAESKPEWTFVSTGVEGSLPEFTLNGDLTVNGVTKPVALEVEYNGSAVDPFGHPRAGFSAAVEISRKDFELTWNAPLEAGGVLVGDKVKISLEISAIHQA